MPAKIAFAGENTYKIYIRGRLKLAHIVETYQTDAPGDSSRKRAQDVHSWVQPLGQSLIATVSLVEFPDLVLKHGIDGAS
jgi:hypothetical protein